MFCGDDPPIKTSSLGPPGPVSRLTLGGGGIGQVWGETSREESAATLRAAIDGGIDLIDTAPMYGSCEAIIGETFQGKPGKVRFGSEADVGARPRTGRSERLLRMVSGPSEEPLPKPGLIQTRPTAPVFRMVASAAAVIPGSPPFRRSHGNPRKETAPLGDRPSGAASARLRCLRGTRWIDKPPARAEFPVWRGLGMPLAAFRALGHPTTRETIA